MLDEQGGKNSSRQQSPTTLPINSNCHRLSHLRGLSSFECFAITQQLPLKD